MEKKEKQVNYFIIERLDLNEESDNLSNIYDLSVINNIKEIKTNKRNKIKKYFKNIIKADKTIKINQEKKIQILQVVKKAILSSNLTYKWKKLTIKQILIFFHIFFFISTITHKIHDNKGNTFLNQSINNTNIFFNITNNYTNYNNSINITNKNDIISYIFNNILFDLSIKNKKIKNIFLFTLIFNQIILIPAWLIFFYKFIPKWDKINDTLYKITSYLLLCESNENNNFFYYLMKDFSILVTKKKYYDENKELLPIIPPKNEYLSDKNIILYCINIINDYIFEKYTNINYYELISNADYNDIKALTIYIDISLNEKLKIYNKKIMIPLIISLIITIIYYNKEKDLLLFSLAFILIIISEFIFAEYIKTYKLNIDKFIDNYNDLLIKKNRFIYRKNKLIMYIALKNNSYTKNQIINFIEKIINS